MLNEFKDNFILCNKDLYVNHNKVYYHLFRAFNNKALSVINIKQNYMAHGSEIIDRIITGKLKFQEVPVTVYYHQSKNQGILGGLQIIYHLIYKMIS